MPLDTLTRKPHDLRESAEKEGLEGVRDERQINLLQIIKWGIEMFKTANGRQPYCSHLRRLKVRRGQKELQTKGIEKDLDMMRRLKNRTSIYTTCRTTPAFYLHIFRSLCINDFPGDSALFFADFEQVWFE